MFPWIWACRSSPPRQVNKPEHGWKPRVFFFFWLLLLTRDTELTKCWVLYDVDVKWLPGLTEDSEWQELSRSTSRSYSGSQGSVGITKVYNGPTYMPCTNHIVAPVAHWGPRTLKIKSCTWRWYAVASGVTGDAYSWSLNNVSIRTSWIWTASIMLILRCKILLSTPPSTDRWTANGLHNTSE